MVIEDDGFIAVTMNGLELNVDAYDAHGRLLEIHAALADELPDAPEAARARAFNGRVASYLADLGFGPVSHRAADKFASALFDAVTALGKADAGAGEAEPTPASPTTTAPQPSASPAA